MLGCRTLLMHSPTGPSWHQPVPCCNLMLPSSQWVPCGAGTFIPGRNWQPSRGMGLQATACAQWAGTIWRQLKQPRTRSTFGHGTRCDPSEPCTIPCPASVSLSSVTRRASGGNVPNASARVFCLRGESFLWCFGMLSTLKARPKNGASTAANVCWLMS